MTDERHDDLAETERRIREAIRSAGDVRADAAFRERLKREFSSGTIAGPAVRPEKSEIRRLPRWTWLLVPAAAAILIVALLLPKPEPTWSVQAVRGEGEVAIDGKTLSTDDLGLISRALGAGGRVRLSEGVSLDLRLDDHLILSLAEGSDATLPVLTERRAEAPLISEVREGELEIMTGPGFPGSELHILTAEGRIEIVGTVVSVYKGDGYTCVCVLEGTARVGVDEARLEDVPSDMLKIMFGGGDESIVTDIAAQHKANLLEFTERYQDAFETPE
jgi:ferric-dicitrate binding protein FerR (iron transport regulator)